MPYSLKGRNVLVTGGSRGLGALLCEKFAAEGCNVAINYVTSAERAKEVAEKCEKHSVKTTMIQGDVGIAEDNVRLIKTTVDDLGGLDIIIANAAWTRFSTFADINDLSHEEWNKMWATNVMSHLQLVQQAAPIFNANPDGGAYLISSSTAGIVTGGSSMGYSVTKAAGLHLMKCLGLDCRLYPALTLTLQAFTQGPKIRVNAVLPGLLLTEWGLRYGPEAIEGMKERAPLKQITNLDDCADAFISAAKNASMTGQQIVIDAGVVIR